MSTCPDCERLEAALAEAVRQRSDAGDMSAIHDGDRATAVRDSAHWRERADRLADENVRLSVEMERNGVRRCDIEACNCGGYHNFRADRLREERDRLAAENAALREACALADSMLAAGIIGGDVKAQATFGVVRDVLRKALSSPSPLAALYEAATGLARAIDAHQRWAHAPTSEFAPRRRGRSEGGRVMASKPHDEFRDAIVQWLNLKPDVVVWANDTGAFLRQSADGSWRRIRKTFGTPGVPDIIGWRRLTFGGRVNSEGTRYIETYHIPQFIGIDVKMGSDRLSVEQRGFAESLREAGGIFIEARCAGKTDFGRMARFQEQWKEATDGA